VAKFEDEDVERLLGDTGIIRHRGKVEATICNARRAVELVEEVGSLAAFFWQYEEAQPSSRPQTRGTSELSERLSKDLKKRGWRFVGPTTAYAFMQAMGLVNDHAQDCKAREQVARARQEFSAPKA